MVKEGGRTKTSPLRCMDTSAASAAARAALRLGGVPDTCLEASERLPRSEAARLALRTRAPRPVRGRLQVPDAGLRCRNGHGCPPWRSPTGSAGLTRCRALRKRLAQIRPAYTGIEPVNRVTCEPVRSPNATGPPHRGPHAHRRLLRTRARRELPANDLAGRGVSRHRVHQQYRPKSAARARLATPTRASRATAAAAVSSPTTPPAADQASVAATRSSPEAETRTSHSVSDTVKTNGLSTSSEDNRCPTLGRRLASS